MSTGSQESDGIDLGRLIGEVIDHKGLIISVTFFFMGLGFLYAFLAPPVYEADSLVQVEQNAGNNRRSAYGGNVGFLHSHAFDYARHRRIHPHAYAL